MDPVAITLGCGWTIAGLVIFGLSIPLVRGKIPRNSLYGVRLPQSFQSDEAWFAINRFGGRRLLVWSMPLVLLGIVCFFLPLQAHPGLTLTLGFAPLVLVLIPAWESWRFAQRYRPE